MAGSWGIALALGGDAAMFLFHFLSLAIEAGSFGMQFALELFLSLQEPLSSFGVAFHKRPRGFGNLPALFDQPLVLIRLLGRCLLCESVVINGDLLIYRTPFPWLQGHRLEFRCRKGSEI